MSASLLLGAIVAGARDEHELRLVSAGHHLGAAFQIHDDLLNTSASMKTLGKRTGTDAARGKATYPRAVGRVEAETRGGVQHPARARAGRGVRHSGRATCCA